MNAPPPFTQTRPHRRKMVGRVVAFSAATIALAVVAVFVVETRRRPVRRDAEATRLAVASGHYREAKAPLDRWLSARPDDPEAQFLRAKLGVPLGRTADVIDGLKRAEALGYAPTDIADLRALIAAQAGQRGESEPILRRAYEAAKGPDALLDETLARIYLETFDLTRARAVLDQWAKDAPDDPRPPLWQTEVDARITADPAPRIAHFREALRIDPELAKARLGLAESLRSAHLLREAEAEFSAYLRKHPDDPAALLGAARVAIEKGNDSDAIPLLDRALVAAPDDAGAHKERAEIARRSRDNKVALEHFDRAVALDPADLATRYSRAGVLALVGRKEEARSEREAVARLRAENEEMGRLQKQLLANPKDRDLRWKTARWMIEHGHDREGIDWLKSILRDLPDDREVGRYLADYYDRVGNPGLANYYRLQTAGGESSGP